jgi:putative endonuclease
MDRHHQRSTPAATGRAAEDRALKELGAAGLHLVARNFRCRLGEIDLVMREGDTLVFVEVRQRQSARFGDASESVTAAKQRKLQAAAALFVAWHPALRDLPMRFDLFALDGNAHGASTVPGAKWLRGIIN